MLVKILQESRVVMKPFLALMIFFLSLDLRSELPHSSYDETISCCFYQLSVLPTMKETWLMECADADVKLGLKATCMLGI